LVVGWFQGRMEFGPRALGSRSIIADARRTDMPSILNRKIKFREGFRPFAPAVLYEHMNQLFNVPGGIHPAYMTFVARSRAFSGNVDSDRPEDSPIDLRPELVAKRGSSVPAVTHLDGTSRIQAVEASVNPLFYGLIQEFYRRTNCPAIINTSFNRDGEPIVCTPEDAIKCFLGSGIDALAIGNFLVFKDVNHGAPRENPVNDLNTAQTAVPRGWLVARWARYAVFVAAYFIFLFPLAVVLRTLGRDPLRGMRGKGNSCFTVLGERPPVQK